MYGSSFIMVTLRPRDSRIAASDAAAMPFPSEETTPPVTKMYLVMSASPSGNSAFYPQRAALSTRGHARQCTRALLERPYLADVAGVLAQFFGQIKPGLDHRIR